MSRPMLVDPRAFSAERESQLREAIRLEQAEKELLLAELETANAKIAELETASNAAVATPAEGVRG